MAIEGQWCLAIAYAERAQGLVARARGALTKSQEHLGRSDAGVAMLRKMFKENMLIVENGGDPLGTVRTPHEIIALPCEKDKFGAGSAFTDQWINGGSMRYAPIREELLALHRDAAVAREKAAMGD